MCMGIEGYRAWKSAKFPLVLIFKGDGKNKKKQITVFKFSTRILHVLGLYKVIMHQISSDSDKSVYKCNVLQQVPMINNCHNSSTTLRLHYYAVVGVHGKKPAL